MTDKHAEKETGNRKAGRRPYEKPKLRALELPLEETMAEGCKLGTDPVCLAKFEGGS